MKNVQRAFREPTSSRELRVFQLASAQLRALAVDRFRITLMSPVKGATYNLGKDAGDIVDGAPTERFFKPEELRTLIPHLIAENDRHFNIFLTPFHALYHYIVLDDLVDETLEQVRQIGLEPSILMMSSPNRYQGIYRLPKAGTSKDEANALFRTLNQRYGDPKISGLVHGFRMAGCTNRKDKYRDDFGHYPFVKLVSSHQDAVQGLDAILTEVRAAVIVDVPKKTRKHGAPANEPQRPLDPAVVEYAVEHYTHLESRYGHTYDRMRADYMLGQRLLAQGRDAQTIRDVLIQVSPGLMERQGSAKKVCTYCRKTVAAVLRAEKQIVVAN